MRLRDCFGELAEAIEEEPGFIVELGGARFLLTVDANGPEKASGLDPTFPVRFALPDGLTRPRARSARGLAIRPGCLAGWAAQRPRRT